MQKPLNWLIAWLLHPPFDINPACSLVDTFLYGFVEQNLPRAALKFLRYSLPWIIRELAEKKRLR